MKISMTWGWVCLWLITSFIIIVGLKLTGVLVGGWLSIIAIFAIAFALVIVFPLALLALCSIIAVSIVLLALWMDTKPAPFSKHK